MQLQYFALSFIFFFIYVWKARIFRKEGREKQRVAISQMTFAAALAFFTAYANAAFHEFIHYSVARMFGEAAITYLSMGGATMVEGVTWREMFFVTIAPVAILVILGYMLIRARDEVLSMMGAILVIVALFDMDLSNPSCDMSLALWMAQEHFYVGVFMVWGVFILEFMALTYVLRDFSSARAHQDKVRVRQPKKLGKIRAIKSKAERRLDFG